MGCVGREQWGAEETLPLLPPGRESSGGSRQLSCKQGRPHSGSRRHPRPAVTKSVADAQVEEASTNREQQRSCSRRRRAGCGRRPSCRLDSCSNQHTTAPSEPKICPLCRSRTRAESSTHLFWCRTRKSYVSFAYPAGHRVPISCGGRDSSGMHGKNRGAESHLAQVVGEEGRRLREARCCAAATSRLESWASLLISLLVSRNRVLPSSGRGESPRPRDWRGTSPETTRSRRLKLHVFACKHYTVKVLFLHPFFHTV